MLNSSGESGHPCCVADLRGEVLFFPIENDTHCVLFVYGLYDIITFLSNRNKLSLPMAPGAIIKY